MLNWMAVSSSCFETKTKSVGLALGKASSHAIVFLIHYLIIGIDHTRYYFWWKPFVICKDLCAQEYMKTFKQAQNWKTLMSQEKNALFEVCNFSRLVCIVYVCCIKMWLKWTSRARPIPLIGCHKPSSSEDFPLFLGTARWEAARWSCCCWIANNFQKNCSNHWWLHLIHFWCCIS